MTTALGPQSPNYTTARPVTDAEVSAGIDTWFKDCSAAGVNDGTIFTASFFNVVLAQMREAIRSAAITLDNSNDLMLWQAMQAAAISQLGLLTASNGVVRDVNDFQLALGTGVLPVLTY